MHMELRAIKKWIREIYKLIEKYIQEALLTTFHLPNLLYEPALSISSPTIPTEMPEAC